MAKTTNAAIVATYSRSLRRKENMMEFVRVVQSLIYAFSVFEIFAMDNKTAVGVFTPHYAGRSSQDAYNKLGSIDYNYGGIDDDRLEMMTHVKSIIDDLMPHFWLINESSMKASQVQCATRVFPPIESAEKSDRICIAMLNPKNVKALGTFMVDIAASLDFAFSPHTVLSPNLKKEYGPKYLLGALHAILGSFDLMLRRASVMFDDADPSSPAMTDAVTSIVKSLYKYFSKVLDAVLVILDGEASK